MTVIAVAVVTIFFSLISLRSKNSSWKGSLIDKTYENDDDSGQDYYTLIFKTDTGKKTKSRVSKETYETSNIGDRYEKVKGEYYPTKIS